LCNNTPRAWKVARPNLTLTCPRLEFVKPTLKIDQVVIPDMFMDVNYMHVPRVDRCMTCHRAIDRPGFESKKEAARLAQELQQKLDSFQIVAEKRKDAEDRLKQLKSIQREARDTLTVRRIQEPELDTLKPWRTHPKLDPFVGSASPHPLLEFGCTSCHRGMDRATE